MGNTWSGSGTPTVDPPQPLPRSFAGCIEACRGGVVVLAGCGGGCDVFGTALLLPHLRDNVKDVILVSLTFTDEALLDKYGERVTPHMHFVRPGAFPTPGNGKAHNPFFPEAFFATAVGYPVYALSRHATVGQILHAYQAVFRLHQCQLPRAIFLTDGGCDVLLTGDETGLATPAEDTLHLRAMLDLPAQHKAILAVGVNVDCGHGMVQAELDDRLDALRQSGAMLFDEFLTMDRVDASYYHRVVSGCDSSWTVVQSLVKAAIEGHRGDYTHNIAFAKAGRSRVPLTDQTATLFGFDLQTVAAEVKYLSHVVPSSDMTSVCESVQAHRARRALDGLSQLRENEYHSDNDSEAKHQHEPSPPVANPWLACLWPSAARQNRDMSAKEILGSL